MISPLGQTRIFQSAFGSGTQPHPASFQSLRTRIGAVQIIKGGESRPELMGECGGLLWARLALLKDTMESPARSPMVSGITSPSPFNVPEMLRPTWMARLLMSNRWQAALATSPLRTVWPSTSARMELALILEEAQLESMRVWMTLAFGAVRLLVMK